VVEATTNGLNITCYPVCVYILCLSEDSGRMVGPDGLSHGARGAPPHSGAAMQARPRHRHRYRHHQSPTARLIPLLEELAYRLQHPAPATPRETADQAVQCNLLRPPPLPGPVTRSTSVSDWSRAWLQHLTDYARVSPARRHHPAEFNLFARLNRSSRKCSV
jgi:hypothetical protein